MGVYGTTGRLEKSYRAYGAELDDDYDIVEADMAPARVKDQDFVGRAAVLRQMAEAPAARLCTLTVDDHTSAERRAALHARTPADRPRGRQRRSSTPRAAGRTRRRPGASPSTGKHVLLAYLPPELAVEGDGCSCGTSTSRTR